MCSADIFLGLLAILFPPLPVWVKCGICSADSIINILLCMLGFIPGLIHSWYIIAKFPEPSYDYEGPADSEGGRVYVFVHDDGSRRAQRPARPSNQTPNQPRPQGHMSYGTNQGPAAASQPGQAANASSAAGPSDAAPPPSYAQVVAGDNKIQSHD